MEGPLTKPLVSVTKKYLSAFSERTRALDLERYHFVLLLIDDKKEQLTQKAIAEMLHLDKSTMVNIIDYLSERDYVVREKSSRDRREQFIRLTDKAREVLPAIRSMVEELNRKSLDNLSENQLNVFFEVLRTIGSNLSDTIPSSIFIEFKPVPSHIV